MFLPFEITEAGEEPKLCRLVNPDHLVQSDDRQTETGGIFLDFRDIQAVRLYVRDDDLDITDTDFEMTIYSEFIC